MEDDDFLAAIFDGGEVGLTTETALPDSFFIALAGQTIAAILIAGSGGFISQSGR